MRQTVTTADIRNLLSSVNKITAKETPKDVAKQLSVLLEMFDLVFQQVKETKEENKKLKREIHKLHLELARLSAKVSK